MFNSGNLFQSNFSNLFQSEYQNLFSISTSNQESGSSDEEKIKKANEIMDSDEDEEILNLREYQILHREIFFIKWNDDKFRRRFRMTKETVIFVHDLIKNKLEPLQIR